MCCIYSICFDVIHWTHSFLNFILYIFLKMVNCKTVDSFRKLHWPAATTYLQMVRPIPYTIQLYKLHIRKNWICICISGLLQHTTVYRNTENSTNRFCWHTCIWSGFIEKASPCNKATQRQDSDLNFNLVNPALMSSQSIWAINCDCCVKMTNCRNALTKRRSTVQSD